MVHTGRICSRICSSASSSRALPARLSTTRVKLLAESLYLGGVALAPRALELAKARLEAMELPALEAGAASRIASASSASRIW